MTKGINQKLCYLFIFFKGSEIVKHEAGVMYCVEREDTPILWLNILLELQIMENPSGSEGI